MKRVARTVLAAAVAFSIDALSVQAAATAPTVPETAASGLLPVGAQVPAIVAVAHDGTKLDLRALRGRYVVLYFYPKDDTRGCTIEANEFRDSWATLQKERAVVFGISTQSEASHKAFAEKHGLPFPLISDEAGTIAAKFGVPLANGLARRVTFLVGPKGTIEQLWPAVTPAGHAAEVLAALRARRSRATSDEIRSARGAR